MLEGIGTAIIVLVIVIAVIKREIRKEQKRKEHWNKQYEKALQSFWQNTAAEETTATLDDDICNNKCGECDIADQCPFVNKRG